jgi:hypothetical protein
MMRPWSRGRRLALAIGVVALGIGILVWLGHDSGPRAMVVGFNEDPVPRTLALQDRTGLRVRRLAVAWSQVEPAPGQEDWKTADAAYAAILARGLRPLLVAGAAPCWARPSIPCSQPTNAMPTVGPPEPAYDPAWASYVHELTKRYPKAIGVEIWNEPNLASSFVPIVDPVRFTALLKTAYRAVKSADSGMPVIAGGLFSSPVSGAGGMADDQFLAAVYAAGGGDSMDAIGAHPYPYEARPDGSPAPASLAVTRRALERLRTVRNAAGHRQTPIWVTELGVSSAASPGSTPASTERQQARLLLAMVHLAESQSDIPVLIIHRVIDVANAAAAPPTATGGPVAPGLETSADAGFGVFRSDGTPKPAACALSREFGGSLRC